MAFSVDRRSIQNKNGSYIGEVRDYPDGHFVRGGRTVDVAQHRGDGSEEGISFRFAEGGNVMLEMYEQDHTRKGTSCIMLEPEVLRALGDMCMRLAEYSMGLKR